MTFRMRVSRVWVITVSVVLLSSGLAALPALAGSADLERELVIVTSGGVFEQALKKHFYAPFTEATGVRIRSVAASNAEIWAKVKAMATTGRTEWDVVQMGAYDVVANRQWLRDLGNCSELPEVEAQGVPGTCLRYGILRTIGGTLIAYNAKHFPRGQHPKSWKDFWDVARFPGARALPNYGAPWAVLMVALMADGVEPDRLFPLDLDRAFRKLDEIKPHVKVWWRTGDQSQQILRDEEVVLAMVWSGRALATKAAGAPIEVEWNQAIKDATPWGVLKAAPHPKAALAFLNFFMSRPDAHLAFSRELFYDTSNRLALDSLPPAERPTRATYGPNWERIVSIDDQWVAEHRARVLERWNAWIAK